MLIDIDGHFPKLLLIPEWRAFGMYMYIKIWQNLNEARKEYVEET